MKVRVDYGQLTVDMEMEAAEFLSVAKEILGTLGDAQMRTMETYRKTLQEAMMNQAANKALRGNSGGNTEA